jgi:hypothetical protein
MKGYKTDYGWFGWCPDISGYRLFSTEEDYIEYFKDYERAKEHIKG